MVWNHYGNTMESTMEWIPESRKLESGIPRPGSGIPDEVNNGTLCEGDSTVAINILYVCSVRGAVATSHKKTLSEF